MGASLRCGLGALDSGVEAAVVVLADGPEPRARGDRPRDRRPGTERRRRHRGAATAACAVIPCCSAGQFGTTVPDEGARALVPVLVHCDDLGAPGDVDYPEDLQAQAWSLSATSFAFSSGDISSRHAVFT